VDTKDFGETLKMEAVGLPETWVSTDRFTTEQVYVVVMPSTCIWEVSGSNLDQNTS
jgi:hypothetical protein